MPEAENITTLNMLKQQGAVITSIDTNDLVYVTRGSGSDRDKVITGGDLIKSNCKVATSSSDGTPEYLASKLLGDVDGNSGNIIFSEATVSGVKKIVATVKNLSIKNSMIANGTLTREKQADSLNTKLITSTVESETVMQYGDSVGLLAEITGGGTYGRFIDVSVRFHLKAVTPEYSDTSLHDMKIVLQVRNPNAQPATIAEKRFMWKFNESVELRLCASDTVSLSGGAIKLFLERTESSGTSGTASYWPGSPDVGIVAYKTIVNGMLL